MSKRQMAGLPYEADKARYVTLRNLRTLLSVPTKLRSSLRRSGAGVDEIGDRRDRAPA